MLTGARMSDFRDPVDIEQFPPIDGTPLGISGVMLRMDSKPVLAYEAECWAYIPESRVDQDAQYTASGVYSTQTLAEEACQNHFIESVDIRADENKDDPEFDARESVEEEYTYNVRPVAIDAPMPA